jgi:hypothetical protein
MGSCFIIIMIIYVDNQLAFNAIISDAVLNIGISEGTTHLHDI